MLLRWLTYFFVLIFAPDYVFPQEISRNKRSSDGIPCENGWFYFKEKCYKIGGRTESLTWPKAGLFCTELGANLVTIETKEENDFLSALVVREANKQTWIGLNDRASETVYQWLSGSTSGYRIWNENEPSGFSRDHEDCIEIVNNMHEDYVGVWNDADCEIPVGYICEKNKDSTQRSPDPLYCSPDQGGGIKFGSSCYHIVMETKTWEEAEQHCIKVYDGHLIKILGKTVDYFLKFLLSGNNSDIWIGIKIRDQFQQKWSSGWYVGYDGFTKGIRDFHEGFCVVRSQRKVWNIVPCSKKHTFICEKSFEKIPILKLPGKDSHCPRAPVGWRDLGGEFCYFIETENPVSWYEANFLCIQRGGNLTSMHSKEESAILHPFIQYTGPAAFIGLYRQYKKDNTFEWIDGSKFDYANWNHGEPNNAAELCGEARGDDMKWNDISCNDKRPYICAVKKVTPNINIATTENPDLGSSGNTYQSALIGVVVCHVLLIIVLCAVIYNFRRKIAENKKYSAAAHFQLSAQSVPPGKSKWSEKITDDDDYDYETMDE